ncbi:uncharacterized protein LOC125473603 [Pyrus x bretschneideri]|uniref:uncharacterized protein LOC125473603 n=1 Tax=Pyrus x bretschneideri TaxID=225117 RepID=UPI00202E755E|nr:uncharacterized protein LOC125473603 [Pyrus x bretschneideri]
MLRAVYVGDQYDEEVMRLEELNVVEIREDSTWLHIGSVFMASSVVELERGVSDVRAELPWTREYGCIYTAPDMFPLGWTGEVLAGASWGWEWVLEYVTMAYISRFLRLFHH